MVEHGLIRTLVADPDKLGDGPVWDPSSNRLTWLDIVGKRLSSCDEDGSRLERRLLHDTPGSHAQRNRGGRLIAFRRRIVLCDELGSQEKDITPAGADSSRERFNDGTCDNHGRFWVGTMDRHLKDPVGALYCISADHTAKQVATGFGISNGIAFSPDYDRLYQCDSLFPRVYIYELDCREGVVSSKRVFVEFSAGMGVPDGCATDVRGRLWVAAPSVGRVFCFDQAGQTIDSLTTPTPWPSSVAFGGRTMRTLFITSLQPHGGSTAPGSQASGTTQADGRVFAAEMATPGMGQNAFGG